MGEEALSHLNDSGFSRALNKDNMAEAIKSIVEQNLFLSKMESFRQLREGEKIMCKNHSQ